MMAVASIFFLGILEYSFDALLVGLALGLILSKSQKEPKKAFLIILTFAIFATLDLLYLPALNALDATFTVGNEAAANFLEIRPNTPLNDFISFDFSDVFIWVLQTFVAVSLAYKFKIQSKSAS
jgi:hypothetical protein